MSRNGSGFRLDQNIGKVNNGPVRMTMRMAQIIIASQGLTPLSVPARDVNEFLSD